MKKILLTLFFLTQSFTVFGQSTNVQKQLLERNYVPNSGWESGKGASVTYADAAGLVPVDGLGGSPNVTLTVSSSSPLSGAYSAVITKGSSNRQGDGVSIPFVIDSEDQAHVLRVEFSYSTSANYACDSSGNCDMRVYLYDITNSRLIEPVGREIGANSFGKFVGTFQASSDSVSYRLIYHVSSVNASSYTVKLDSLKISNKSIVRGVPDVYLGKLTTTGSWNTNTTYTFDYWRRGEFLIAKGKITTSGAPNATALIVNLPTGYVIDSSKLAGTTSGVDAVEGNVSILDSGVIGFQGQPVYRTTTSLSPEVGFVQTNQWLKSSGVDSITPMTWTSGDTLVLNYEVPIVGWGGTGAMSEDGGTRSVLVSSYLASSQNVATLSETKILFDTTSVDTAGLLSTSNNRIVFPESSTRCELTGQIRIGNLTDGELVSVKIKKNGSSDVKYFNLVGTAAGEDTAPLEYIAPCSKGDYFEVWTDSTADSSYQVIGTSINTTFNARIVPSPQTIYSGAAVVASYETNAGQNCANSVDCPIVFEDLIDSTHPSAMNTSTGVYTVAEGGYYDVSSHITFADSTAWGIGELVALRVLIDGSDESSTLAYMPATSATNIRFNPPPVRWVGYLRRGQTIAIAGAQASGGSLLLNSVGAQNQFRIIKVGN